MSEKELYLRKLQEIKDMEELLRLKEGLPHLFGYPWYKWAKRVFDARDKQILLTAANQVSKSATATRKNIHWATATDLWPELWPGLFPGQKPNLFWYFYPTLSAATTEFETKWKDQYLPKNDFKNDKKYGWKEEYFKGEIFSINFNSGVSLQFKSYAQKLIDLQTASVYMVTADEEMPVHYLPEITARLNATDGYFLSVFTATLGQLHWKQAMEPSSKSEEKHPDALKIQVSLYDSQFYEDGTPSPWTDAKIKRAIANCPTEAEIQRRIYGKFVKSTGLKLESFALERNLIDPHKIDKDWIIYSAVDPGSGGQSGHPAGIIFIAVRPDYKYGVVFKGWRGDNIPSDSSSILDKYRELRGNMTPLMQLYDYASHDFFSVASKVNENFIPADKSRDAGYGILNTLFKNKMLQIFRGDPELEKLVNEIMSLPVDIDKRKAQDDLVDPTRYIARAVPWDYSDVELFETDEKKLKTPKKQLTPSEKRRAWYLGQDEKPAEWTVEDELDYWDDLSGALDSEY